MEVFDGDRSTKIYGLDVWLPEETMIAGREYVVSTKGPLKEPEKTNMAIFCENSEDIYAGIEYEAESDKAKKLIKFLIEEWA